MTMNFPRWIVLGEALTNRIREADGRWRSAPGGSRWHVARVGARRGVASAFASAILVTRDAAPMLPYTTIGD